MLNRFIFGQIKRNALGVAPPEFLHRPIHFVHPTKGRVQGNDKNRGAHSGARYVFGSRCPGALTPVCYMPASVSNEMTHQTLSRAQFPLKGISAKASNAEHRSAQILRNKRAMLRCSVAVGPLQRVSVKSFSVCEPWRSGAWRNKNPQCCHEADASVGVRRRMPPNERFLNGILRAFLVSSAPVVIAPRMNHRVAKTFRHSVGDQSLPILQNRLSGCYSCDVVLGGITGVGFTG